MKYKIIRQNALFSCFVLKYVICLHRLNLPNITSVPKSGDRSEKDSCNGYPFLLCVNFKFCYSKLCISTNFL